MGGNHDLLCSLYDRWNEKQNIEKLSLKLKIVSQRYSGISFQMIYQSQWKVLWIFLICLLAIRQFCSKYRQQESNINGEIFSKKIEAPTFNGKAPAYSGNF